MNEVETVLNGAGLFELLVQPLTSIFAEDGDGRSIDNHDEVGKECARQCFL